MLAGVAAFAGEMKKQERKTPPATSDPSVAVRIPESMRHRAKIHAAQAKRDLQDVLAEIVDEGLKKRGA